MRALEEIKVLDFSVGHDASAATMYLADNGAEIIKVEDTSTGGDIARTWEPMVNGKSAYFELLNRGKKSISLDFAQEKSIEIIKKLISNVDVIVENLQVDYLRDIGLSYEVIKKINPAVIYMKVSPFGTTGPKKNYPLTELTAYAIGGYLQVTGMPEEMPSSPFYPIISYSCAHLVVTAICSAYISRMMTGRGQMIDISLADCAVGLLEDRYVSYQYEKLNSRRVGNAHPTITPYDTVPCKGGFASISPSTQVMWENLCKTLGFPEIANDPEYSDIEKRQIKYFKGDLKTKIVDALKDFTPQETAKLLNDVGIPAAPVYTLDTAYNCEQFKAKGIIVKKQDDKIGEYAVPSVLGEMSKTPVDVTAPAPVLGEHTDSILEQFSIVSR